MFGMLDYRAHKLYLVLFGLPLLILKLAAVIGLPLLVYSLGLKVSDDRLWQILSSVGMLFVVEILWMVFVLAVVSKIFAFLFGLIVDIIPADGRDKQQAQQVVWHGEKAIVAQQFDKHPNTWTDDFVERFVNLDWVAKGFFREKIETRIEKIREYYEENPSEQPTRSKIDEIKKATDTEIKWNEKIFTMPAARLEIYRGCFFLWLLYEHPFK